MDEVKSGKKILGQSFRTGLTTVVILVWFFMTFSKKLSFHYFIISVICLWVVIFINSLLEYLSQEPPSAINTVFVGVSGLLSLALSFVFYDLIFSSNISASRNYELYKSLILLSILFFALKGAYKMFLELTEESFQRGTSLKHLKIVLKYLLAFLMTFMFPLYQLTDIKYEASLSNLRIPEKLEARVISEEISMENIFKARPEGEIKDKKLIDDLFAELRTMRLENIRNLDQLNYIIMSEKSYPFIEINVDYEPHNLSAGNDMENGYFSSILVFNNGQVVLQSYNRDNDFFRTNFYRKFRVPLSKTMMDRLNREFQNLNLK